MTIKQRIRAFQRRLRQALSGTSFASPKAAHYDHLWSETVTLIPVRSDPANRQRNLELAVAALQGLHVGPGQVFSFWKSVPAPTLANGFLPGPAFSRGKVIQDVGGGLCLVSTNLYNTFLQAGLEILERHNHSIDPYGEARFFPLGRDAMVYYGYKDLAVHNQLAHAFSLRLELDEQRLKSVLWAPEPLLESPRLESEVVEQWPAPGPEGMPGYRTRTRCWQGGRQTYQDFSQYAACECGYRHWL
ncbi:MAG: VanW family protein [Candidatus Eremiobacteraeota bacterium]|nr:VanW family protein [Candidatus Eremiobacteraeota bacterium]MCW5868590.1 VanW family protein [Candidatus Eremiobacteraeota bacterium]